MTQDVQPLTWQKRTNLEEHQQFFSKINEIIANLAPTVDEAEQAIAQATAAIASANDAIATANAASAAASAAASQAQTAVSTVAGYDARLTATENSIGTQGQQITVLQGRTGVLETGVTALGTRMTAAEGKITAIEGREADYLKKTGAAQTVTSQIMVPTTAAGVRDTQIANGTRIQNDLDAYSPMIRNTGNQTKAGQLTLTSGLILKAYQAETIEATNGPRLGTNTAPTQVIMRLYQNANDSDYVARDTVFQGADTKNLSRIWYLQRQNEAGDGIENASLSFSFNAQTGRATLSITDSQGTRVII